METMEWVLEIAPANYMAENRHSGARGCSAMVYYSSGELITVFPSGGR